jgi:hypothetical protein
MQASLLSRRHCLVTPKAAARAKIVSLRVTILAEDAPIDYEHYPKSNLRQC